MVLRNIQVIDGADNCAYDVFAVEEHDFDAIFPGGRDVEFADEFAARVGEKLATEVFSRMWTHRLNRKTVQGLHGTLFYGLAAKKAFYPTKKEAEMVTSFGLPRRE
jgi:hypothetical protein